MTDTEDDGEKVLFAEERKRNLVEYINEKRSVTVPQLCRDFNVSSATIRNDLRELDETGDAGDAVRERPVGAHQVLCPALALEHLREEI